VRELSFFPFLSERKRGTSFLCKGICRRLQKEREKRAKRAAVCGFIAPLLLSRFGKSPSLLLFLFKAKSDHKKRFFMRTLFVFPVLNKKWLVRRKRQKSRSSPFSSLFPTARNFISLRGEKETPSEKTLTFQVCDFPSPKNKTKGSSFLFPFASESRGKGKKRVLVAFLSSKVTSSFWRFQSGSKFSKARRREAR
jgi:hypothetical protein